MLQGLRGVRFKRKLIELKSRMPGSILGQLFQVKVSVCFTVLCLFRKWNNIGNRDMDDVWILLVELNTGDS